jgi:Na+/melibiose symporter-like transporter
LLTILLELVHYEQAVEAVADTAHNQVAALAALAAVAVAVVIIHQFTLLLTEHTSKPQEILHHLDKRIQAAVVAEVVIIRAILMVQEAEAALE